MNNEIRELSMDELETVSGCTLDGMSALLELASIKLEHVKDSPVAQTGPLVRQTLAPMLNRH